MTLIGDIRTNLRMVTNLLGETWQYRLLTSNAGVEPRTYGIWTNVVGVQTGRRSDEQYDDRAKTMKRISANSFRITDETVTLKDGDQLKDADLNVWAVLGILSGAGGTIRYNIERITPTKGGANRGGGI